jgi:hypothetical protein
VERDDGSSGRPPGTRKTAATETALATMAAFTASQNPCSPARPDNLSAGPRTSCAAPPSSSLSKACPLPLLQPPIALRSLQRYGQTRSGSSRQTHLRHRSRPTPVIITCIVGPATAFASDAGRVI